MDKHVGGIIINDMTYFLYISPMEMTRLANLFNVVFHVKMTIEIKAKISYGIACWKKDFFAMNIERFL